MGLHDVFIQNFLGQTFNPLCQALAPDSRSEANHSKTMFLSGAPGALVLGQFLVGDCHLALANTAIKAGFQIFPPSSEYDSV